MDRASSGPYERILTQRRDSVLQPFHLPRTRLGAYMREETLDASLAEVADAAGHPILRT